MNKPKRPPSEVDILLVQAETENNKLQEEQIRNINESMRKVRTLSKKSQQFAALSLPPKKEQVKNESAGLYLSSPGTVEEVLSLPNEYPDDTGRFFIPSPTPNEAVTSALSRAFDLLEQERKNFKPLSVSPVVKSWRII